MNTWRASGRIGTGAQVPSGRWPCRPRLGPVAAPALVAAVVPAAYAANAPQPHAARATIAGDVMPGLKQNAARTGNVAAAKRTSVAISLPPSGSRALDTFVADVSDPHSAAAGWDFTASWGLYDAATPASKLLG